MPCSQALRYIIRNTTLPQRTRAQAQLQLTQMHCYTRPTQINNRCIMAGKGRGVFRAFRMARVRIFSQAPNMHTGLTKCSIHLGWRHWRETFLASRRHSGEEGEWHVYDRAAGAHMHGLEFCGAEISYGLSMNCISCSFWL